MRARLLALLTSTLVLPSCAYTDRYPFHTEAGHQPGAEMPPGVRVALALDGVHDMPREGVPLRSYEMRIDLEQESGTPQWIPSLDGAVLRDDEGNSFPASAWFSDASRSDGDGLQRYRVVFELDRPYRFPSILVARVHWTLTSRGQPDHRITSTFRR